MSVERIYLGVVTLVAVVVCITIHEFSHALMAVKAGDDTPRLQGRISLNPVDHFDILGFLMIAFTSFAGFGIGWGKPVQIQTRNFRSPRWDSLKVSLWGPLSNILTAVVVGLVLRFGLHAMPETVAMFLTIVMIVSCSLAFFNLIPVFPLDGEHIVEALLPVDKAQAYARFMTRYGMPILIGLIFFGHDLLQLIIGTPTRLLISLLLGRGA
jgi:Zn-dependent protease